MTVVRLATGGLWVHSPIDPHPELVAELSSLGEVRFVVAPNKSHHLFFLQFVQAFPGAIGFVAPGLTEKRPELGDFELLGSDQANWEPDLRSFEIEGLPLLRETVWFHQATGTLILTDLLFCIGHDTRGVGALAARLLGVYERVAMSRTMKMLTKDKVALRRSVAALKDLNLQRIVLAHDQIIEDDPGRRLDEALRWLNVE
jgi:hypothetical protein